MRLYNAKIMAEITVIIVTATSLKINIFVSYTKSRKRGLTAAFHVLYSIVKYEMDRRFIIRVVMVLLEVKRFYKMFSIWCRPYLQQRTFL